jgi:hypothetical protein
MNQLYLQAISKMQITFKDKARADEKAQHTWKYLSILKRLVAKSRSTGNAVIGRSMYF